MTHNLKDDARARIARVLPGAIDRALTSYQLFLEEGAHDTAKDFKAHHDACKVAIAHVELLIKLASWADVEASENLAQKEQIKLHAMMENAKKEVLRYKTDEDYGNE